MNQQFYRYFEVLAEELNYTRAAGILGIAQSSLSHGIQCLEDELSVPLFEKRGRGVVLTPQGALFLPYVSRSLRILEEGKAQLLQVCDGIISIGVVSSFRSRLMERIRSFRKTSIYPDCHFTIYEGGTESLISDLQWGRLDMVIASFPGEHKNILAEKIFRQELVFIAPIGYLPENKKDITIAELSHIPMIRHTPDSGMRKIVDSLFELRGIMPFTANEASEDDIIVSMVASGMGCAIVTESESIHMPGIHILSLNDPENYRYLYLSTKKDHFYSPAALDFISFLSEN